MVAANTSNTGQSVLEQVGPNIITMSQIQVKNIR